MAWAFQDPEHGSTTSKASGAPTTTFVNPEYQPVTNRSHVSHIQDMICESACIVYTHAFHGELDKPASARLVQGTLS